MPFDPRVHVGVGICVVNSLNRLLMIERQGAHGAGQWSIVGGWVDFGETPEEAAIREMKEEVGITVENPKLIGTATHVFDAPVDHSLTLFYKVPYTYDTMHADIQEPDKISKIAWVCYDHLGMLDLFPPFANFVERGGYRW